MLEAPGVPCATRRVLGNFSWWFILHRAFPALPPSKVGLGLGMSLRGWPPGGGKEGGGEAHPQRERERERVCVCMRVGELELKGNLTCLLAGILEI